jgi:hypothetical protein
LGSDGVKNSEEETGHQDGRRRRKTGGNPSIEEAKTPGGNKPVHGMRRLEEVKGG